MSDKEKAITAVKAVFGATEIVNDENYKILVDDLLSIVKETVFVCREALLRCKWEVGHRINQEFQQAEISEHVEIVKRLSKDIKWSASEIYRCIQFVEKFPEENSWENMPEGKNISWNKVKEQYLPDAGLSRLALAFPHMDSLDKWGIVEWWESNPDKNFVLYIKDPKYHTQLKIAIINKRDEAMTPLKEAFKTVTDYFIFLKKWDRKDMDASDYTRLNRCTRQLLLKSKGDINKIKQAMDWVASRGYEEWNMDTVVKKYPEALRPGAPYEKYMKKGAK